MNHHPTTHRFMLVAAFSFLSATAGRANADEGATTAVPAALTVPAALAVPAGQVLVLAARGIGEQIYECAAAKDGAASSTWTLKAPQAQLRDAAGNALGKHYAGPTWESNDGSKVIGEVVSKSEAPDADAIPWLLLRAKSTSGSGRFSSITSIQRVHTLGGKAPATPCDGAPSGKEARVPYAADYLFYAAPSSTPVGTWKTFDDKTGQPRAIVRIYEQDGKFFGRIEQSFTPGAEHRVCTSCTDDRKNNPVIGLLIIRNMKSDGGEYAGGDILDPDSGSVYRCKMHLEQDGARLVLRGYIGFSLLGRSQTWQRQG